MFFTSPNSVISNCHYYACKWLPTSPHPPSLSLSLTLFLIENLKRKFSERDAQMKIDCHMHTHTHKSAPFFVVADKRNFIYILRGKYFFYPCIFMHKNGKCENYVSILLLREKWGKFIYIVWFIAFKMKRIHTCVLLCCCIRMDSRQQFHIWCAKERENILYFGCFRERCCSFADHAEIWEREKNSFMSYWILSIVCDRRWKEKILNVHGKYFWFSLWRTMKFFCKKRFMK